jgi:glycosyltransferase involved in cell wall biosynthesis
MSPPELAVFDLAPPQAPPWDDPRPGGRGPAPAAGPDPEFLRACAWEVGERRLAEAYCAPGNHVGLASVAPHQGFAYWRIHLGWAEQAAREKGGAWHHCRPVLRLYDVSCILFNGFNAHHVQDHTLPSLCGQMFFRGPRPGSAQLAEVGFLLRGGEFVPAARSAVVAFARDTVCANGSHAALLVDGGGRVEEVANVWEQAAVLRARRQPRLRAPLRIAAFGCAPPRRGEEGTPARFAAELAAGQLAEGHEVHLFAPRSEAFADGAADGLHHHPLDGVAGGTPLELARSFSRAARERLEALPPFDLLHFHEWMTGLAPWAAGRPTVLSLSSVEATRRNGGPAGDLSRAIEEAEREAARRAGCVLTPAWLRDRAAAELGLDGGRVRAFPMEGRPPSEWEQPLDYGQVKKEIHFGPLDRLLVYVGPLEHAAGVDLLVEALPVLLGRAPNLRLAFVGGGGMHGPLQGRAHQLGVAHAVRLLGHVEGPLVARLVRAAEALVLPSRCRVPGDDAVVDLARRAGRPVITTHAGPAYLVRHEETGIVTYDNPGSVVWAADRILGDPGNAERMGRGGRREEAPAPLWGEVARHYLELIAARFPELTVARA